jgi:hypothetical protein
MNSDFVQLEAEELAKRVKPEPDNRTRIRKVYLLAYGREPIESEIQLGLTYLRSEPLREYEENKNKPKEDPKRNKGAAGDDETPATITDAAKPAAAPAAITDEGAPAAAGGDMGMGMMAGMGGPGGKRGQKPAAAPEVKYEATAWGRYVKVLLSSTEFMFIN